MAQIRCPQCRTVVTVAPEQEGQVTQCGHCHAQFIVSSALIQAADLGREPGLRSRRRVGLRGESIKEPGTELPADSSATASDSPALRQELARFTGLALPDLGGLRVDALPPEAEAGEHLVGTPEASLHIPASSKRNALIAGFVVLAVGLALLLTGIAIGIHNRWHGDEVGMPIFYSVFILAVGCALIFGKRGPAQTYWVCPAGMIWQWGKRTGFCRWHEIARFSSSVVHGRAVYWFSPTHGINIVLRQALDPDAIPFAEYIELKASAALLPVCLQRFQAGERVRFGKLAIDRYGVYALHPFWQYRRRCPWNELMSIHVDAGEVRVDGSGYRGFMKFRALDVSFPMVVQAIARIVAEEWLPPAP